MGALLIIAVVLLTGPAAIFFGADSRRYDDRGWNPRNPRA